MQKQDPYQAMRFKIGGYAGDIQNARQAFTNDIVNAQKLQNDLRLIERGLPGETFPNEYKKLQSNNYRILSEVYKDVQALRTLNFTEKEIRDLLSGRRALSKKDVTNVMNGFFYPENIPNFKKDSAVRNAINNINRELGTEYNINDFINRKELNNIRRSYLNVPLGLSNAELEEYLKSTPERKFEIKEPIMEEREKLQESQQLGMVQPQVPAAPFLPDPQIANMFAQAVDPISGLTRTESALLSNPLDREIAKRT